MLSFFIANETVLIKLTVVLFDFWHGYRYFFYLIFQNYVFTKFPLAEPIKVVPDTSLRLPRNAHFPDRNASVSTFPGFTMETLVFFI